MKTIFFGGSFDPFHSEHLALIENAKKETGADRVVVFPSFAPPHKNRSVTPYEIRKEMVKLATKDLDYVVIDDIEKERGCVNYSFEVIPLLQKKYPSDVCYFLIGGDSMVHFFEWKKPEILAKQITLAVMARGNVSGLEEAIDRAEKEYGAKILLLQSQGKTVSSSVIRAKADLGMDIEEVAPAVKDCIERNELYRDHADLVRTLREDMPERTFRHVCRTVVYALSLNTKVNLPYEKVFLAALLHDCAKHIATEREGVVPAVVHQYTGAERAQEIYGIEDEDVLEAIRYHTTGKPDMTPLQKLIFCADVLEDGRDFSGVETLREAMEDDFEKGFVTCLLSGYKKLTEDKKPFDTLTKECVSYYTDKYTEE